MGHIALFVDHTQGLETSDVFVNPSFRLIEQILGQPCELLIIVKIRCEPRLRAVRLREHI